MSFIISTVEWIFDGIGSTIIGTVLGLIVGGAAGGFVGYKVAIKNKVKQSQKAKDNANQVQIGSNTVIKDNGEVTKDGE